MDDYPTIRVPNVPGSTASPRPVAVVICETTGRWASAVRRELAGVDVLIRETRSAGECLDALIRHPAAVVAVALERRWLPLITTLAQHGERRFPWVEWLLLGDRNGPWAAEIAAVLGATYLARSPRQLDVLGGLVLRQVARYPAREPSLAETLLGHAGGSSGGETKPSTV